MLRAVEINRWRDQNTKVLLVLTVRRSTDPQSEGGLGIALSGVVYALYGAAKAGPNEGSKFHAALGSGEGRPEVDRRWSVQKRRSADYDRRTTRSTARTESAA